MNPGDGVMLEYKMKKGEELTYLTRILSEQEIITQDQSGKTSSLVEMTMLQKCMDVSADGVMSVDVEVLSGKIHRDGNVQDLPGTGEKTSVRMKKSGEMVEVSTNLPFEQPSFPTRKMKNGDSWTVTSKIQIPGSGTPAQLVYTYSLANITRIKGANCAEIKVKSPKTEVDISEGVKQSLETTGSTFFSFDEGRLVKSIIETKADITAQDGTIRTFIKVEVELDRVTGSAHKPLLQEEGFIIG